MTFTAPRSWYAGRLFGWPIVVAAFFGMLGNIGPILFASFGFFMADLTAEFGWKRDDMSLTLTVISLAIAAALPPAGMLIDRFGVRRVLIPSLVLLACVLLSAGTWIDELWHLYVAAFLLSVLGIGANSMFFVRPIAAWFDRRRGLMIGIVASGTGVGVALLPALTQVVIAAFDWRMGFAVLGLFVAVVLLPVIALFLRNSPTDLGLAPDGAMAAGGADMNAPAESGLEVGQALRTRVFWLLAFAMAFATFGMWGLLPHFVPVLTDRGMTIEEAALAPLLTGLSMAVARLAVGFLIDRYFAPLVGGIIYVLVALGFLAVAFGGTSWPVFVGAVFIGIGLGSEVDLLAFLISRYFGLRSFGTLYGLVFIGFLAGTSLGPFAMGLTFERAGSYDLMLLVLVGAAGLSALMFAFMGKYDQYRALFGAAQPSPAVKTASA